jgi:hypothetical protein
MSHIQPTPALTTLVTGSGVCCSVILRLETVEVDGIKMGSAPDSHGELKLSLLYESLSLNFLGPDQRSRVCDSIPCEHKGRHILLIQLPTLIRDVACV